MSLHTRFHAALLDPERAPPGEITSWNGSDPAQRFAVYRNNVTVSLIEALGAAYPVVQAMVGEDFFRDMARLFLRSNPPRSPLMMQFGEDFPDFLGRFEPLSALPYLPDLARLERARRRAYHARDAAPEAAETFAAFEDISVADLRVTLHPSVSLLSSPFAVVSLWGAHQGLCALEEVDPATPEDALVLRPHFEVDVVPLPSGGAAFFTRVAEGRTLGDAAEALSPEDARHLPLLMHLLIHSGMALACHPLKEP